VSSNRGAATRTNKRCRGDAVATAGGAALGSTVANNIGIGRRAK